MSSKMPRIALPAASAVALRLFHSHYVDEHAAHLEAGTF
jgi:hypothetical protein